MASSGSPVTIPLTGQQGAGPLIALSSTKDSPTCAQRVTSPHSPRAAHNPGARSPGLLITVLPVSGGNTGPNTWNLLPGGRRARRPSCSGEKRAMGPSGPNTAVIHHGKEFFGLTGPLADTATPGHWDENRVSTPILPTESGYLCVAPTDTYSAGKDTRRTNKWMLQACLQPAGPVAHTGRLPVRSRAPWYDARGTTPAVSRHVDHSKMEATARSKGTIDIVPSREALHKRPRGYIRTATPRKLAR